DGGRKAMESIIAAAIDLFDMLWLDESEGRSLASPETKAGFKSALLKRAQGIAEPSVRTFFIHEIDQRIQNAFFDRVPEKKRGIVHRKPYVKRQDETIHAAIQSPVNTTKRPKSAKTLQERILIGAMILHPRLYDDFAEAFGLMAASNSDYDQI